MTGAGAVGAADLAGRRLAGVAVAWHEVGGRRSRLASHVWLEVDGLATLQVHTPGDGSLGVVAAEPYRSYDMGEQGRVVVERAAADFPLAAHTGETIIRAAALRARDGRVDIGVVLRFPSGAVALANVADELLVRPWPSAEWDEMGIVESR